jgi:hypothetical protein
LQAQLVELARERKVKARETLPSVRKRMEKQLRRKSDEASDYAFVMPREQGKEIPCSQHGAM